MSIPRLTAWLLALVTLAVYLPVAGHGFLTYDDNDYVTDNAMVQQGLTWRGVQWACTTFAAANWHPLTWLSHMTDCELFGLHAGAPHLVNALFHAANAALLFLLWWRLTGSLAPAAIVAALFAWHPTHVESVAWVAERKDVLSTFFALLALLCHVRFAREDCRRSYWLALIFFGLGLLAKPMLVTLPFLLLLLDYWPLNRFDLPSVPLRLLREKWPFFLLAAASCVVTFLAQRTGHAVISLATLPWSYRLENAVVATGRYLLKLLWPAHLAVFYPYEPISAAGLMLALAGLVVISIAVWLARQVNRCWLMGWLWFLGTLVPVIGLLQVGGASMADRYTYIPSIGIFVAVVFGLYECRGRLPGSPGTFPAAMAAALVMCVFLTEKQLGYWRDSETLFRHALAVTPDNYVAHDNLGLALEQQADAPGALAQYREALRLNPAFYQLHYASGKMLAKLNQPAAAFEEFQQYLGQNPADPVVHEAAGRALLAQGKAAAAVPEFAAAGRLAPNYAEPHLELAKIYLSRGENLQAGAELKAAVRAGPDDYQTLAVVARYLAASDDDAVRDSQGALLLAVKANDLSGNRVPEVLDALGMAFAATGNFSNAVACAQNALTFAPDARLTDIHALRQRLELYQNRQPWRESFRATNAPPQ